MDNEGCNTHLRLVLVGNHVVTFQNDMFRRKDVGSKIIIDCLNHQKAKITVQVQGDEDQSTDTEVAHEESFTNVNDFISQEPGIPFRDVESPPRMDVPNDEIPTFNVTTHHEETQNSNLNDHSGGQQHNQGNSGEHHRNLHNEEGDMNAHMRRPRAQPGRSAKVRAQASLKDLAKNSKGSKTSRRSRIRTTLVRKNNVTPSRQPANDVGPSEFTPFSGRSHTLRETANRDSQNNEGFDMHSGSHNTGSNPNIEKSTGSEPSSTNLLLLELEFLSFYVVYILRLGLPGPGDAISMGGLISAFRDFLHEHMPHLSGVLDLVGPEALQGALVANLRSILLNYKMDVNVAEGNLHFTADK